MHVCKYKKLIVDIFISAFLYNEESLLYEARMRQLCKDGHTKKKRLCQCSTQPKETEKKEYVYDLYSDDSIG
jgi:hypothetical protein